MKKDSKEIIGPYSLVHKQIIVDDGRAELVLLKKKNDIQNIGYVCGYGRIDVPLKKWLGGNHVDKKEAAKRVDGPLKREYKSYTDIMTELIKINTFRSSTDKEVEDDILTFKIMRDSNLQAVFVRLDTEYTLRDEVKEKHPTFGSLFSSHEAAFTFHTFTTDEKGLKHFDYKELRDGLACTLEGSVDADREIWKINDYMFLDEINTHPAPETFYTAEEGVEFFDVRLCPVHDFKIRIKSPTISIKAGEDLDEKIRTLAETYYQVIGQLLNREMLISSGLRKEEKEKEEEKKNPNAHKKALVSHEVG